MLARQPANRPTPGTAIVTGKGLSGEDTEEFFAGPDLSLTPTWYSVRQLPGALTPLSVDGMIVAASTTLLADSRSGGRGGALSWLLLGAGSVASLAANVAAAEPTITGRVIAAWPSLALIGSYELLMRQIRATATVPSGRRPAQASAARAANSASTRGASAGRVSARKSPRSASRTLQHEAFTWAMAHRDEYGTLPSGKAIAEQFGRHERWGRLVKQQGDAAQADATEGSAA